jgi:glycerol-3-phosphate O-acyltransferase
MEDRNLLEAQTNGTRAFRFSIRPIWRYLRRQTWLRITGKFHRYGYAAVCFGDPLSLTDFYTRSHSDPALAVGEELMARIAKAMPITPVPLVCHALVNGTKTQAELERFVTDRIAAAKSRGAIIHIPRDDIGYTIEAGLRALTERRLLSIDDTGTLHVSEAGTRTAGFYAASVAHLLDEAPESSVHDTPESRISAT